MGGAEASGWSQWTSGRRVADCRCKPGFGIGLCFGGVFPSRLVQLGQVDGGLQNSIINNVMSLT